MIIDSSQHKYKQENERVHSDAKISSQTTWVCFWGIYFDFFFTVYEYNLEFSFLQKTSTLYLYLKKSSMKWQNLIKFKLKLSFIWSCSKSGYWIFMEIPKVLERFACWSFNVQVYFLIFVNKISHCMFEPMIFKDFSNGMEW